MSARSSERLPITGLYSSRSNGSNIILQPPPDPGSESDAAERSAGSPRHILPPPGSGARRRQSRPPGSSDPQPDDRSAARLTVPTKIVHQPPNSKITFLESPVRSPTAGSTR